jgi:hypothetical protein
MLQQAMTSQTKIRCFEHRNFGHPTRRTEMIKLITFAGFALALATSVHAMSPAPLHQSGGIITQVREACGAGMHMVNGACRTTSARRHVRRGVITGY